MIENDDDITMLNETTIHSLDELLDKIDQRLLSPEQEAVAWHKLYLREIDNADLKAQPELGSLAPIVEKILYTQADYFQSMVIYAPLRVSYTEFDLDLAKLRSCIFSGNLEMFCHFLENSLTNPGLAYVFSSFVHLTLAQKQFSILITLLEHHPSNYNIQELLDPNNPDVPEMIREIISKKFTIAIEEESSSLDSLPASPESSDAESSTSSTTSVQTTPTPTLEVEEEQQPTKSAQITWNSTGRRIRFFGHSERRISDQTAISLENGNCPPFYAVLSPDIYRQYSQNAFPIRSEIFYNGLITQLSKGKIISGKGVGVTVIHPAQQRSLREETGENYVLKVKHNFSEYRLFATKLNNDASEPAIYEFNSFRFQKHKEKS